MKELLNQSCMVILKCACKWIYIYIYIYIYRERERERERITLLRMYMILILKGEWSMWQWDCFWGQDNKKKGDWDE